MAEARAGLAASMRNREVRRVQLAWAACATGDLAQDVALGVHAFSAGGVAGVGVMGLVRSLPAAGMGPLAAGVADRYPRQRVLLGVLVCRTALLGLLAWSVAAGASLTVVYVVAAADSVVYTLYWPAQSALLPDLARTPEELTASNAVATLVENLGTLVGPGLAGVVLVVSGPDAVFTASALLTGVAALVTTRVATDHHRRAAVPESTTETLLGGFRAVLTDGAPRLVLALYLVNILCMGALSVLVVVMAIDLLDMGEAGVGFLSAALGAGGVVGSVTAFGLVGHRRLTRPYRLALILWGASLATVAVAPGAPVAAAALVVLGGCTAVIDVCALNLLQRLVRERVLGRVLGVVEGSWWAMFGLGSLAAALLADAAGDRAALAITGGVLVAVTLLAGRALGTVDARAQPPAAELAALQGVPLFAAQPPLALERLAQEVVRVSFSAGEPVVVKGEAGDRFYMIEEGSVRVVDTAEETELGPGDWFGEIALLGSVPRTATVRAVTAVRLFALGRDDFLAAVAAGAHGPDGPLPGHGS